MKKLFQTLALTAVFSVCLMGFALADVADVAAGPMYAMIIGVPVAIIAVAVIIIVLIIRAVRKKRASKIREHEEDK